MTFSIHARNFFLTFPEKFKRVSLSNKEMVLNSLKEIFQTVKANPNKIIVSFEESDDDHAYRHYHVYLELDRKFWVRDPRFFDLNGVHGQYESCRSKKAAERYAKKDGDFIEFSVSFLPVKPSCLEIAQYIVHFIRSRKQEGSVHDLFQRCIEEFTEAQEMVYFMNKRSIENAVFLAIKQKESCSTIKSYSNFKPNEKVLNWLKNLKNKTTLVLLGPSGIGKTEFVKSLFSNALLVSHKDQLKNLQSDHDGIIFDDMSFDNFNREELIHLFDIENDRAINARYDIAPIQAGTARAITSNRDIDTLLPNNLLQTDVAIKRRVFIVMLTDEKLF